SNVSLDTSDPTASITGQDSITCDKSTDTLIGTSSSTASGNINFDWNTTSGNITNDLGDSIIVNDSANYELVVSDPTNGCQDSATVFVDMDTTKPFVDMSSPDGIDCANLTDTLYDFGSATSSGSIKFDWNTTSGNIIADLGDSIIVDDSADYTLIVTDPITGCEDSLSKYVSLDTAKPTADIRDVNGVKCPSKSDTLDGRFSSSATLSGLDFNWSTSNGNIIDNFTDSIVVNDSGDYKLV
ncbi:MAG: hypothetical protein ABEH43_09360, partial [Flavobacteriales bacterium]